MLDFARANLAPLDGGAFVEGFARKLVIHTTEGMSFAPNPNSYFGKQSWPHFTLDRDGTLFQHIGLNRAARALKNLEGGTQTNRGGAWQVEVVGKSSETHTEFTDAQMATLRRLVLVLKGHGLGMQALPTGAIALSATFNAPQRMSAAAWKAFDGICGHRHVPENDHWDPGAFELSSLLPDVDGEAEARQPGPKAARLGSEIAFLAQAVINDVRTGPVFLVGAGQAIGVPTQEALDAAREVHQPHPDADPDGILEVHPAYLGLYGVKIAA